MEDEIQRLGREAEHILSTDVWKKIEENLEKPIIEAWAAGQFKSSDEREDAFARVRGARLWKASLNAFVENMKVQKAQAERRAKLRQGEGQSDD